MPSYIFLLREDPDGLGDLSPEQMQQVVESYRAWADGLQEAGQLLGGEKLADGEGRVIVRQDGRERLLDGPYSETKEVVGGFFQLAAESYDQAVEIARSCPHLEYGGRIEIRRIEEMD